jgi:biopolymer transport protein ExbD
MMPGDHYIFAGREHTRLDELKSALLGEAQILERHTDKRLSDVTIVIRADRDTKTGNVQEVIQSCQQLQFEKFALRGQQSDVPTIATQ